MKRPPPRLQTRALGWLAQREHSRSELRRKLLRHAKAGEAAEANEAADTNGTDDADEGGAAEQVDRLLDALQAQGLLSEQRFVESRVRVRAPGMGTRRIQTELARHGLKLPPQSLQQLRESELQRALQLWRRRFAAPAADERERARQARFLAGRGFDAEVIRKVLGSAGRTPDEGADNDPA